MLNISLKPPYATSLVRWCERVGYVRADSTRLLDQITGDIVQVTGDGAYDKKGCYQAAYKRNAKAIFPPQHNAALQRNKFNKNPALTQRDNSILFINSGGDRQENLRQWKQKHNYHRRSLVETMMSRMKTIFGDQMRSKTFENQRTDLLIRCYAINKMNQLGLPVSEIV